MNWGLILSCITLALSILTVGLMYKRPSWHYRESPPPKWEGSLASIAGKHTQVAGALAGFSITIVVLIASFLLGGVSGILEGNRILVESTFGMFMISFFGYTATGVTFSLVAQRKKPQEYFLFSVASLLYYLSVLLSFSGLLVLVRVFGVSFLVAPVSFLIAGSAIGGHIIVFVPPIDLLGVSEKMAAMVFCIAASITGVFVSVVRSVPALGDGKLLLKGAVWAPTAAIVILFLSAMCSLFWQQTERHERFAGCSLVLAGLAISVAFFITAIPICCVSGAG